MPSSPQWKGGRFRNPRPVHTHFRDSILSLFRASAHAKPKVGELPRVQPADLHTPPSSGLRVTWMGHSTLFLELDGVQVLTDPIWSERASPFSGVGPRRWYPAPLGLEQLPRPHIVVISHNHYDHLDRATVLRMKDWETRFVVPLGVGALLRAWGIPSHRITELDWWDQTQEGGLTLTCTPSRHASGRGLLDRDQSLWAGFAFHTEQHRVYFSGDTGFFPEFEEIGQQLGPFDLTCFEIGAYAQAWPDWHLGPEQALKAHTLVQGRAMLPIHWGLFDLSTHGWTEPAERLVAEAQRLDVPLCLPRPWQSFEPGGPIPTQPWWPSLPWRTAVETPIIASEGPLLAE